jgi:hypothetical protein
MFVCLSELRIRSAITNPNSSIQIQYQFATLVNGAMKLRLIAQLKKPIMLLEHFVEDA